jgi:hypothetical protein
MRHSRRRKREGACGEGVPAGDGPRFLPVKVAVVAAEFENGRRELLAGFHGFAEERHSFGRGASEFGMVVERRSDFGTQRRDAILLQQRVPSNFLVENHALQQRIAPYADTAEHMNPLIVIILTIN